jgi:hypothetical protein
MNRTFKIVTAVLAGLLALIMLMDRHIALDSSAVAQVGDVYHEMYNKPSGQEQVNPVEKEESKNKNQEPKRTEQAGDDTYHSMYSNEPSSSGEKKSEVQNTFLSRRYSSYYRIEEGNGVVLITALSYDTPGGYADALFRGLKEARSRWDIESWNVINTKSQPKGSKSGYVEATHILALVKEKTKG